MSNVITGANWNTYDMLIDNTYYVPSKKVNDDTEIQDELSGKKKAEKKGDGKDDGSIGFWGALKNIGKGVGKFFKGLVCDESGNFSLGQTLKTLAIGGIIGAATVLIPGAGAAIAIAGLGIAGYHVGGAAIDVATAKTDAEAEQAWQNMGSGLTEGALAYVGARGTGAFGKIKSGVKSVKTAGSDVYSAYKAGGVRGAANEASAIGKNAWSKTRATAESTWKGTQENWSNLKDVSIKHNKKLKQYDEKIANAKTPEAKAQLTNEKAAYQKGYDSVAQEANYTTAKQTVKNAETAMENAKKAYNANKTDANKAAYENAKVEYQAANKTLETRVNKGDFKVTDEAAMKTIKDNTQAQRDAMHKAREDYNSAQQKFNKQEISQADLDAAKATYESAQNSYHQAVAEEVAATGKTSAEFIINETAIEGLQQTPARWMTVTMAGRGREDYYPEQMQYIA